ncbi:hypothetical protein [Pseudomaricurvus sp. HS19]|uniref:hypothetical protein n=1 Tax=Pseudomaricurvus sp. HS19 TaxID=2692626 RepID=UPI00136A94BA|nr:hypothetical protein [Pseudomaricurvus sp. HS19]MYM64225.1 hypothetical protein [Pseudomaricurvus sp. HS19]
MAVQALPIIKALAPYVAQIASVAIPAFTSRKDDVKTDPVVVQQIEELQAAATQNAQSIHTLAEKLQLTMEAAEVAASEARRQVELFRRLLFLSLGVSALSLLGCVGLLLTRGG